LLPNDCVPTKRFEKFESMFVNEIYFEEDLISVFTSFGDVQTVIPVEFPPISTC